MRDPLYPPSPREIEVPLVGRSSPITTLERLRIVLLYVALGLPLLMPWVCLGFAIWFGFALENIWSLNAALLVTSMGGFCSSLRAYTPRWNHRPQDIRPVSRNDQPGLWNFVSQVAEDQSARVPDGIIVNASADCRSFDFWAPIAGLRSRLVIGHWILELFTLGELKALLAIRLAIIRGTSWQQRIARLRRGLELSLYGDDRWTVEDDLVGGFVRLGWYLFCWPLIALQWLTLRLESIYLDPFDADAVACKLAGSDATMLAIVRADIVRQTLKSVEQLLLESAEAGFWSEDIFSLAPVAFRLQLEDRARDRWENLRYPRTPALARDREWFELGTGYVSKFWTGSPEGDRREEYIRRAYIWNEADLRLGTLLVENLHAVRRELTYRQYHRLGFDLASRHPMPNSLIEHWHTRETVHPFPPSVGNLYDHGRLIDPATADIQIEESTANDEITFWNSLPEIYLEAGKTVQRWSDVVRRLDDIDSKDERTRKDDIQYEHLQKARRELNQSLGAFDTRLQEIHLRLATRIEEKSLAEELRNRTQSVVSFQKIVAQARRWDRSLRADCEVANELARPNNRDTVELSIANKDALDRLDELLEHCESPEHGQYSRLIEGVRLDRFLCSHTRLPESSGEKLARRIETTWLIWREFRRKADWLHLQLVVEMLQTQEQIAGQFAERMLTPTGQTESAD